MKGVRKKNGFLPELRAPRAALFVALVASAATLLAAKTAAAFDLKLPLKPDEIEKAKALADKASKAAAEISDEEEVALGREVAANLVARFGLCGDETASKYVRLVGGTLAKHSKRPAVKYRFAILESDTVNAFAAAGGYIFVTKGALKIMSDESELAAVLAHEIAHIEARHTAKEIRKANIAEAGADLTAMLAKDKETANKLTAFSTDLLFKGYSRKDENEADSMAVGYIEKTGYDVEGFSDFLKRIGGQKPDEPKFMIIFKTHPSPKDRIALVLSKKTPGLSGARNPARFKEGVKNLP